jgi:hypothetical protein
MRNIKKKVSQIHFNKRNHKFKSNYYLYIGHPTNHIQTISTIKTKTHQKVLFDKLKTKLQLKRLILKEKLFKQDSFASRQSALTLQQTKTKTTNVVPHL